ncbi:MAG: polyprenyl synthetase family protein, partial [Mycobacteriaceae bacterium]|nr:polyprenyl synthetase family protein [Mycobacteriaceae bacterium]
MIPAIPRHDLDRTAGEALAQARVMCDAALHAAIDDLPKPLRHMAGYHFGWWDADGAPDRADAGKAL